jgi:hypothetical protein
MQMLTSAPVKITKVEKILLENVYLTFESQ